MTEPAPQQPTDAIRARDHTSRVWLFVFLTAALLLGVLQFHLPLQTSAIKLAGERKPMTQLDLPQLDGGRWKLADHRGQVVLINYWATWCEPCQEELPGLLQVAREYAPERLAMVGISLDVGPDARGQVRQFADRFRLTYPVAFPAQTWFSDPAVMALPTTVLLDRRGRIAKTYQGPVEPETLGKDITTLLIE